MALPKISRAESMGYFANIDQPEVVDGAACLYYRVAAPLIKASHEVRAMQKAAAISVATAAGEGRYVAARGPSVVEVDTGGQDVCALPPSVHDDLMEAVVEAGRCGRVYTLREGMVWEVDVAKDFAYEVG